MESSRVREPRRTALHMAHCLGFLVVVGLVFGLTLTSHLACAHTWSDSGFFLVARASLSQDRFQREGFWEVGRIYQSPDQDLL